MASFPLLESFTDIPLGGIFQRQVVQKAVQIFGELRCCGIALYRIRSQALSDDAFETGGNGKRQFLSQ